MNIVAEVGGIFLPILHGGPLPVISSRVITLLYNSSYQFIRPSIGALQTPFKMIVVAPPCSKAGFLLGKTCLE